MKGLIHIYCGDGKGKTTAALGLALRWGGYDLPVTIAQFNKNTYSGETETLKNMPCVTLLRLEDKTDKFVWDMSDEEKSERRAANSRLLEAAVKCCESGGRRLVILDELCSAMECGLINAEAVMDFVMGRPDDVELVITGRNPSDELCAAADYITEMRSVKHPMDSGISAREGVEF